MDHKLATMFSLISEDIAILSINTFKLHWRKVHNPFYEFACSYFIKNTQYHITLLIRSLIF